MVYENSNSQTLASFNYTLDIAGNRTQMQDNEGITDYTFDNLNRLTRVEYPDSTFEQFAFDNGSRRIHHEDETGSTSYLYNLGDRLLATTGQNAASFNYDLNGNLTEKTNNEGTYQYSYSARDRLQGITTPDGNSEDYRYYPLSDLRYSLTKNNDSSDIEKYLYGGPNVIEELKQIEGNGSTDFETVASYLEGLSIDEHLGRVIHDITGQGNPDEVYAYITDPLGTIRNLVDSSESIVNTYNYKAYGNVRNQTGTTPNPYLFTGRRWSDTTKDYYYRARHYMPDLGMFSAVDRYAPGEATYGYAAMNPLLYRDPRGESALATFAGGAVLTAILVYSIYEGIVGGNEEVSNFVDVVDSSRDGNDVSIDHVEVTHVGLNTTFLDYAPVIGDALDILSFADMEPSIPWIDEVTLKDENGCLYSFKTDNYIKMIFGVMSAGGLVQMYSSLFSAKSVVNVVDDVANVNLQKGMVVQGEKIAGSNINHVNGAIGEAHGW
jgi:RHS repeat-associated protein